MLFPNVATVTILLNEPPVAEDDFGAVTVDGSVDVDVLANDADSDGTFDPATVSIVTPTLHGRHRCRHHNGRDHLHTGGRLRRRRSVHLLGPR